MTKTPRQLARNIRDTAVVRRLIQVVLRGDAVHCPCCDSSLRGFRSFNGPNRICPVCGSMERHRLVWLYLDDHPEMLVERARILHIAPENVLRDRFQKVPRVSYHGGDLTAEFGPERIDVTALDFPDESMDVVVCNHVLEHVPDDRLAMAEIRRVLKPEGWALLLVPGLEGDSVRATTDEDPSVISAEERLKRFGQADHVRMYGWDYLDRLRDAGLSPQVVNPAEEFSPEQIRRDRLTGPRGLEPLLFARPTGE